MTTRLKHETDFQYAIVPPDGASTKETTAATTALVDAYRAAVRTQLRRAERIEKMRLAREETLTQLVGDRALRRFQKFSRKQRQSVYGITDFRPDHFNAAVLREAQHAAQQRSHAMLRRAGVEAEALRKVQQALSKRLRRMAKPTYGKAERLEIVPLDDPALGTLHGSTDGWFVKTPPYDNWFYWYDGFHFGGTVEHRHNVEVQENPFTYITGKFGHFSRYLNRDTSDWDALFLTYRTGVGFWYTAETPGPRDVWVKIKANKSRVDVWLDNEYGWSESWSDFDTRIEISVKQLQGIQGATDDWHADVDGEPDDTWHHEPLVGDNAEIWIPFTVNFPPGPVLVWIISNDHRQCGLNDVSTDARMETEYMLEEVHII
jgi:hypothetical protein